jgi:hypothetical protein
VRIFLAEKGVSIPCVEVDLAKLEHKTPEFSGLNPFETIPILELDDGTRIAETIAICRYIEAQWPEPMTPTAVVGLDKRTSGNRGIGSSSRPGAEDCEVTSARTTKAAQPESGRTPRNCLRKS